MYFSHADVAVMTEQKLRELLELKVEEGPYLDYKRQLSSDTWDKQARNFLQDVIGFANANGGDLIIGMDERAEGVSVDDQIVGIDEGPDVARKLESLAASSIEPRIPGLLVKPLPLENGKAAIIVHVPPSLMRPHMGRRKKERFFYIRHSESSVPMSAYEIRESVIASLSAEAKAREYLKRFEDEVLEYGLAGSTDTGGRKHAVLFIQAMPLIPQVWDVCFENVKKLLGEGADSSAAYPLRCGNTRPTIDGLMGTKGGGRAYVGSLLRFIVTDTCL